MGRLHERSISAASLVEAVSGPGRGGVAVFLGTVRDHHAGRQVVALEYSAYLPMAEAVLERLIVEAKTRWPVEVVIEHRLGRLAIGDIAVGVAVGGGHRTEAFEACRFLIEELKARVPIWKRERYADGSEAWVDPTAALAVQPAVAEGSAR